MGIFSLRHNCCVRCAYFYYPDSREFASISGAWNIALRTEWWLRLQRKVNLKSAYCLLANAAVPHWLSNDHARRLFVLPATHAACSCRDYCCNWCFLLPPLLAPLPRRRDDDNSKVNKSKKKNNKSSNRTNDSCYYTAFARALVLLLDC